VQKLLRLPFDDILDDHARAIRNSVAYNQSEIDVAQSAVTFFITDVAASAVRSFLGLILAAVIGVEHLSKA